MHVRAIPYRSALEQRRNIAGLAQASLSSALNVARRESVDLQSLWINDEIDAPRATLVNNYLEWARSSRKGHGQALVPAHMFSQWCVPFAMRVLIQGGVGLAGVVNLGCDIQVNGPIQAGERLLLSGDVINIFEDDDKLQLSVRIITHTRRHSNAIEARIHCAFPKQGLEATVLEKPQKESHWETAGAWAVDGHDGLRFALLTGDFNPIHWSDAVARSSFFKHKVLHGFASLSLSWVALESRHAIDAPIQKISARFVRPVLLPSSCMYVMRSKARQSGARRFSLRNGTGQVFMLGSYSL